MDQKKITFISKNINIIDTNKKEYICRLLLYYNVHLTQTNNGVYCYYSDLNENIINSIYNYMSRELEK